MIVVDASAILAVYLAEPERDQFREKMLANMSVMSPVNFWEAMVRAQAVDGVVGRDKMEGLVGSLGVEIVAIDADAARLAADAFARFGKRSPAGLNLGDCFAYALAQTKQAPLLFKGDDFTKTDVAAA